MVTIFSISATKVDVSIIQHSYNSGIYRPRKLLLSIVVSLTYRSCLPYNIVNYKCSLMGRYFFFFKFPPFPLTKSMSELLEKLVKNKRS